MAVMSARKHILVWISLLLLIQEEISLSPTSAFELECRDCIQVGGIFERGFHATEGAFRLAMEEHNRNASSRRFQAHFLVDIISTKDAFKIARLVCNQFSKGVWALLVSVEPDSFDTLHSYANTFQMPLLTPTFPQNVEDPSSGLMDYALSLQPDYHRAILDIIRYYGWERIIYLYDSHDGLLRLQNLFRSTTPRNATFTLEGVQRVSSSLEALDFLYDLEARSRWSKKYVVLDSSEELAKDLIIRHVRDVRMGKRNFHFLLSGLVMDDRWEEDVAEFGAVNITGFHLVDTTKRRVKEFLQTWRMLNPKEYPGAGEYISAQSALMYDSVRLVTEAVSRYQRRNPESLSTPKNFRRTLCDLSGPDQMVFGKGEAIARLMRKVRVEGLTGNISFDDEGRRNYFSLDVVEMTVNSRTTKIGTWSDTEGLKISSEDEPKRKLNIWPITRNKTYVITSILEKPFLMYSRNNNGTENKLEGYVKDLIEILALKMGFNYTLQLVKDNTYGMQNPLENGRWNGMVGELVRNEVDFAVAPLTITSMRENVIDFSKPFMTQGISIMIKRPGHKDGGVFSFMAPFSEEIWMCVVFACVGVSVVLFLVSRFSPYEWKINDSFSKPSVTNELSICNSFWFTLGSILQQGSDIYPRSLSGRIVGSVWWFFALVLVSSYTANLAAFLTIERMSVPIKSADDLSKQTVVEYGMRDGGSTKEFFKNSRIDTYARMWEFMSGRKDVLTQSYEEGIERVRTSNGRYAFLIESVKNDYVNEQLPCDTVKIGRNLNTNSYGIATPKGSPLTEELNMAILELREDGTLAELKNKWWFQKSQCGTRHRHRQDQETSALTLSNVAGVFYVLTGGLVLALIVAFGEFCFKSRIQASNTEATSAVQCSEETPDGVNNLQPLSTDTN